MKTKVENPISAAQVEQLNHQLREEFMIGAEKFAGNVLHQKLKSDISIQDKLTFIPRMLFYSTNVNARLLIFIISSNIETKSTTRIL